MANVINIIVDSVIMMNQYNLVNVTVPLSVYWDSIRSYGYLHTKVSLTIPIINDTHSTIQFILDQESATSELSETTKAVLLSAEFSDTPDPAGEITGEATLMCFNKI